MFPLTERVPDRFYQRGVVKLVDHVAVARERQASVVTELACDIDDASPFVQ